MTLKRLLLIWYKMLALVNAGRWLWWAIVLIFGDEWLHRMPDQPTDQTDPEPVMA
ncbi:hypothetical protein JL100_030255 (plasmid) [Skermanella mucosa]|uniref:hypothetical protein n=1 Tax=Skermanella mucosa TaxID=1789672 RepID=UPI00192CBD69|nr:hypothetical protein [Skermanella mucosa]UEM24515.1 hypothetical protein JL100_030255 [Skermanella mucosa]